MIQGSVSIKFRHQNLISKDRRRITRLIPIRKMETTEFIHLVEKLQVRTILRLSDATENITLQKKYSTD